RVSIDDELDATRACMRARPHGSRIEVVPGPINVVYTYPDLLLASVALARETGTRWHTHLCAPKEDPEIFRRAHGVFPVEWLAAERGAGVGRPVRARHVAHRRRGGPARRDVLRGRAPAGVEPVHALRGDAAPGPSGRGRHRRAGHGRKRVWPPPGPVRADEDV